MAADPATQRCAKMTRGYERLFVNSRVSAQPPHPSPSPTGCQNPAGVAAPAGPPEKPLRTSAPQLGARPRQRRTHPVPPTSASKLAVVVGPDLNARTDASETCDLRQSVFATE